MPYSFTASNLLSNFKHLFKICCYKAFPHKCIRHWFVECRWFYWRSGKASWFVFGLFVCVCLKVLTPNSSELSTRLAHFIAHPPCYVISAVIVCRKRVFSTHECWFMEVVGWATGACLYSPGQSQSQSGTCDITCFHVIRQSAANLEGFHLKIPI